MGQRRARPGKELVVVHVVQQRREPADADVRPLAASNVCSGAADTQGVVHPMAGRLPRKQIAHVRGSSRDGFLVDHASSRSASILLNALGLPEPLAAFMHCPTR